MAAKTDTRAAFVERHNARSDYRHPIVMPDVTRWADLFGESIPWKVDTLHNVIGLTRPIPVIEAPDWRNSGKRARQIRMPVGPYLSYEGRKARGSAAVIPTEATIAAVAANTIVIERDSMSFKVIEWAPEDDGTRLCLVTCDHNQIIGGIWLTVIEASELPEWLTA